MILDRLPSWLVKFVVWLASRWPWLGKLLNRWAINGLVGRARSRPHPWSTAHDYISWTSLTDQRYSARHLAAVRRTDLPPEQEVIELFRRPPAGQVLDGKSTCLFPAFAQYLTDGFIRTRMPNSSQGEPQSLRKQNTSNHQIDLCPLYGRTPAQTAALRDRSGDPSRRGCLKSQLIDGEEYAPFLFDAAGVLKEEFAALDPPLGSDDVKDLARRTRIFAFGGDRANAVPQVAMMNTLLLREHNRLAHELASLNIDWDDDQVFETARMIVIVVFIKLVVEEYINHISPLPFPFVVDAAVAQRAPWNRPNWITTEFSLLYRWHSLIPDQMSWNGRRYGVGETLFNNELLLQAGLARAFAELSAQKAGRLGAFNTADALLAIEAAAVRQDRLCCLAPYAAYREYVGLSVPRSFTDISSDPRVVELLGRLYGTPGEVEFYVGLFCEDQTPNSPLAPLILALVAIDAFSQALTNPLLSEHVYKKSTFTCYGWNEIQRTRSLADLVDRNVPGGLGGARVAMAQPDWAYRW